jgi:hypothetical protein
MRKLENGSEGNRSLGVLVLVEIENQMNRNEEVYRRIGDERTL